MALYEDGVTVCERCEQDIDGAVHESPGTTNRGREKAKKNGIK